jgi:hypothetical protein
MLQVAHATETANEDDVRAQVRSHLVGAGTGTMSDREKKMGHPVEEGDGELGG